MSATITACSSVSSGRWHIILCQGREDAECVFSKNERQRWLTALKYEHTRSEKKKRAVHKNIPHPAAVRPIVIMRNRKEADCLGALSGVYVRLIQMTTMGRNNDLKCHKNITFRWTLQGKLHRSHNYLQFTSTWGAEGDSHGRIYQLEINNIIILVNLWVLSPM